MNPDTSPTFRPACTAASGSAGSRRSRIPWILGLIALVLAGFRTQYRVIVVKGDSMAPTLHSGELLFVSTRAYSGATPGRGDLVIVRFRGELIVKRVVGLPGEVVGTRNGRVFVDGHPLAENSYETLRGWLEIRPGRVIDDSYAVLGDNRSLPPGVMVHAVVPKDGIVGKVVGSFRFWPG